jgi:hypothetical protein
MSSVRLPTYRSRLQLGRLLPLRQIVSGILVGECDGGRGYIKATRFDRQSGGERLRRPCLSGEPLTLPISGASLVIPVLSCPESLSILLITLVMRVLVDIPLAALFSEVALAG